MRKAVLRAFGIILLIDGLATFIFGRKFVRFFRFGARSSFYRRTIDWMLRLPSWLLRFGAAGQSVLGVGILKRAPVDVPTLYRNFAGFYAFIDPGWRKWFYAEAHQALDQNLVSSLPRDGDILDLGSGLGGNLSRFIEMGPPFGSYTGVDLSPAMLRRAKERYGHLPNVAFLQVDLLQDALPEGPFDLIVSTWVFEHLPDRVFVAHKAWKNLKPGGRMVLLFEIEAESLLSRLVGWIYPVLSVRLIQENEVRAFPGTQSIQYFHGPLGEVAVVMLSKPLPG